MSILHIAFYPSDWLSGTRGLSDAETGVYITLIARMYEMAGPLDRDDERLARLCGCKSKASFTKALEHLISEGKIIVVDGGLFNERVEKEIKITTEKSGKAKTAAESRWSRKSNKNKGGSDANALQAHSPSTCQLDVELEVEVKTDVFPKEARGVSTPTHSQADRAFVEFCNHVEGSAIPAPRKLTPDRKRKIEARLKEHGSEVWVLACRKLVQSAFCNGSNDRGWIADLDFLCQPKSFNRLIEGGYDSRASPSKESKTDTAGRKFIERGFSHDTQDETNDLRNVFSLPAIR